MQARLPVSGPTSDGDFDVGGPERMTFADHLGAAKLMRARVDDLKQLATARN